MESNFSEQGNIATCGRQDNIAYVKYLLNLIKSGDFVSCCAIINFSDEFSLDLRRKSFSGLEISPMPNSSHEILKINQIACANKLFASSDHFFLSATVYLFALLVTGMLPAKNRLKCHWKIFGDNMEATNIDCTVLIFYVWALQKWSTNKVKLDFRQCQQAFKKNLLKRFVSPWKLADWSRKRAAMNTIKKTRPCTVQLTFFVTKSGRRLTTRLAK